MALRWMCERYSCAALRAAAVATALRVAAVVPIRPIAMSCADRCPLLCGSEATAGAASLLRRCGRSPATLPACALSASTALQNTPSVEQPYEFRVLVGTRCGKKVVQLNSAGMVLGWDEPYVTEEALSAWTFDGVGKSAENDSGGGAAHGVTGEPIGSALCGRREGWYTSAPSTPAERGGGGGAKRR